MTDSATRRWRHVLSTSANQFNRAMERLWRTPSWWELCLILTIGFTAWWYFHVPPTGYSITAMAVAASIMALRPEMTAREKSLWLLAIFAFAIVEIRAIKKDRAEYTAQAEKDRRDQNERFNKIAEGLAEAIKQSQQHFNTTMASLDENIKTFTGGDSYCYVTFAAIGRDRNALTIVHRGRYPLYGVQIRLYDLDKGGSPLDNPTVELDRLPIGTVVLRQDVLLGANGTGSSRRFNIFFHAMNGTWEENLRMRKIGTGWVHAIRVRRNDKVIFQQVQPTFGKLDWSQEAPLALSMQAGARF